MTLVAKIQLFIIQTVTGLHTLSRDERGDNNTISNTAWAVAAAIVSAVAIGVVGVYINNKLGALK